MAFGQDRGGAADDYPQKNGAPPEEAPGFFAVLWEYVWTLGLMALVVFSARSSLADWYEVPSGSMLPTILEGDRIFVNKLAYNLRVPFTTKEVLELGELKRGDIVVFLYPRDQTTDYVKRLIGLPGDELKIRDDLLYINGELQPRVPVSPASLPPQVTVQPGQQVFVETLHGVKHFVFEQANRGSNWGPRMVQEGEFYAMGDNRDNSSDSRVWGGVPFHLLKGRALRVVLSVDPKSDYTFFDPRRIRFGRSFLDLYADEYLP